MKRQTAQLNRSRGMALITVLLLLILLSSAAVALMFTVNTEAHLQKTDDGNGTAYYNSEAGMEKMMTDLSNLYSLSPFPTTAAITGVGGLSNAPPAADLNGATFSDYTITVPQDAQGNPAFYSTTVHGGANDGLLAQVLPLTLSTTAVRPGGGEQVNMQRKVEVAIIPVFQFGIFSNTDVDFFAGPNFVFGGRVHTNGNLFLADGGNLTLLDKVHASFDIVRDTLADGVNITGNHTGNVYIPISPNGCPVTGVTGTPPSTCRALGWSSPDEGSAVGGTLQPPGIPTAGGTSNAAIFGPLSTTTYTQGFLLANVPPLNLPFVQSGVDPVEIIRQPQTTDNQALSTSRLYNKAQIWILLADTQAELPGGSSLQPGTGAGDAENIRLGSYGSYPTPNVVANPQAGFPGDTTQTTGGTAPSTPKAVDGWIRVMYSTGPGATPVAVTDKWLQMGISRQQKFPDSEFPAGTATSDATNTVNANAILLFQQLNDGVAAPGATASDFIPINLYDQREGEVRDVDNGTCNIGGVMSVVDIDVLNLSKWIAAQTAKPVDAITQNGYGVYFSDRRGMKINPKTGTKTGDYGFTDVINESDPNGAPNNQLDQGEIPNVDGITVEQFGGGNLGLGFVNLPSPPIPPIVSVTLSGNPFNPVLVAGTPPTSGCQPIARKAWISGARHAVRLINGSGTNLPARTNPDPKNIGGFTLASENPVYVRANYNATTALGFGGNHASAAAIADTVSLQSRSWTDLESFQFPTTVGSRSNPIPAYFRLAIASGKNKNFSNAATSCPGGCATDYGTDGGMHNFLRLMENWGPTNPPTDLNYTGSMVSLYYSHYATGVFKCCKTVYSAPTRNFNYDTDFQTLNKMPPLTPTFQQVVNVGYSQTFAHQ
jgi:hypothetical protein